MHVNVYTSLLPTITICRHTTHTWTYTRRTRRTRTGSVGDSVGEGAHNTHTGIYADARAHNTHTDAHAPYAGAYASIFVTTCICRHTSIVPCIALMCIHTYTHTHIHTYTHTNIHTYTHTHIHTYSALYIAHTVLIYIDICMHAYTFLLTSTVMH